MFLTRAISVKVYIWSENVREKPNSFSPYVAIEKEKLIKFSLFFHQTQYSTLPVHQELGYKFQESRGYEHRLC